MMVARGARIFDVDTRGQVAIGQSVKFFIANKSKYYNQVNFIHTYIQQYNIHNLQIAKDKAVVT